MMNCMAKMVMIIWLVDQVTTVWMAAQDQMHCMGMIATIFCQAEQVMTPYWGGGDDVLIVTDLERDYLNGGEGDDSIHSYGADVMTGGDGADTFVYTDVDDEPIEITDFDPTVDTMAIQFHENDVGDTSVHPVSEDVYEIRLGDQVAAHVKSIVPFGASSIVVQTHT
jgi:Ca2+-binding RTX toxin-like protein